MATRKKSAVGLDIGHGSLRLSMVERIGNTWKVTRFAEARTPEDSVKESIVIDPETLASTLKDLFKTAGIGGIRAHVAVSGPSVFVRPVTFPSMSVATLRKSIRFEAGRFIPGSVDESLVDFHVLGEGESKSLNVLLVAAGRDVVDSRIRACQMAGIEVEGVDLEPFAAYRSTLELDAAGDIGSKTVALVDIGASTTSVSIVDQGTFAMNRSITFGGRTLTDALGTYFQLSLEEAEEGKTQLDLRGLMEGDAIDSPPLKVLQNHVDDLVREIRRSLNYYQSQQQEGPVRTVEKLALLGGATRMSGFCDYLSGKLGMEIQPLSHGDSSRWVVPLEMEQSRTDWAVSLGLAMRPHVKAA